MSLLWICGWCYHIALKITLSIQQRVKETIGSLSVAGEVWNSLITFLNSTQFNEQKWCVPKRIRLPIDFDSWFHLLRFQSPGSPYLLGQLNQNIVLIFTWSITSEYSRVASLKWWGHGMCECDEYPNSENFYSCFLGTKLWGSFQGVEQSRNCCTILKFDQIFTKGSHYSSYLIHF